LVESVLSYEEVIELVIECIDGQFPKDCSCCGLRYASLREYLRQTQHLGNPISHDADMEDWTPWRPLGTQAFANCHCGNTLAIGTEGMGLSTMWKLLRWARAQCRKRAITTSELLESLRAEIDRRVLAKAPEVCE
jgi:hypothetical protein